MRTLRSTRGPSRSRTNLLVPLADATAALLASLPTIGWSGYVFTACLLSIGGATGSYRPRLSLDQGRDLPRLLGHACLATVTCGFALQGVADAPGELVRNAPLVGGALVLGRMLAYPLLRHQRAGLALQQRTLVIGAGNVGVSLVELLRQDPSYGLHPVGFVDADGDGDGGELSATPVPIVGAVSDLRAIVAELEIRHVIVAFGRTREVDLVQVIRETERDDVEIHLVPRLFELGSSRSADRIGGIPLVRLHRAAMRPSAWRTKRAFDVALTAAALAFLAPVLAAIALAVRLSSPGPVLFRQRRVGQHGRPFEVLKFRTMQVNDDSDSTWSVRTDPRITPVGKVLRRTSLDELPQLLNVLRGDMSLVGPRPERPAFDEQYRSSVPRYGDRLRMPVGLTGLAQVHGLRGDTSIAERVWFDNRYIEDWSLWEDITILVRTFIAVLREPERGSRTDEELALYRSFDHKRAPIDLRTVVTSADVGVVAEVEAGVA